jgi:RimJ/RimL family protein N-acetyltransferase
MSKMQIVPFKQFHVQLMNLREWDRQFLASTPEFAELSASYFEKNGFGYTGLAEEGVVGAAGLVRVLPGNWEAWAYTTNLFPKYGIQIHRTVKRMINLHFEDPAVRRIQCVVDSKHFFAIRWAEALGLQKEATLKRYGPAGQNFYMMARTK